MDDGLHEPTPAEATENPLLFWGLLALVVIVWGGFWCFTALGIEETEKRGQFGDMFGAANSLFSGLAFACLVYAIVLQRKELALQREELRLTRQELIAQNRIIADQLRTWQDSHQLELAESKAMPVFIPERVPGFPKGYAPKEQRVCYFRIGSFPAYNVSFESEENVTVFTGHRTLTHVEEGKRVWVVFNAVKTAFGKVLPDPLDFTIRFTSRTGHSGSAKFRGAGSNHLEPAQRLPEEPAALHEDGAQEPHDKP
jgi:hypothetical protein